MLTKGWKLDKYTKANTMFKEIITTIEFKLIIL